MIKDIEVNIADNFFSRLKGLMFVSKEIKTPLLLTPSSRIHSCFMKQPIDVVYLNQEHEIVGKERIDPWKMGKKVEKVTSVLEGQPGFAKDLHVGDQLNLIKKD